MTLPTCFGRESLLHTSGCEKRAAVCRIRALTFKARRSIIQTITKKDAERDSKPRGERSASRGMVQARC